MPGGWKGNMEMERNRGKRHVIGLTGSMGAGKSAAAKILAGYIPVLDLDAVNAGLLEAGGEGSRLLGTYAWVPFRLLEAGGEGSRLLGTYAWVPFSENGAVDRSEMAARMFADPVKRKQAEGILHPLLWKAMEDWIQDKPVCAVEVPLLFETGSADRFDSIWCVICRESTAIDRLIRWRGFTEAGARERLQYQFPAEKKARASDVVLHNDGTLDALREQMEVALHQEGIYECIIH